MKKTSFTCDRCGAPLGEDGAALERTRFCTQDRIIHSVKLFKRWKKTDDCIATPVVHELCEKCRENLDQWLRRYDLYD